MPLFAASAARVRLERMQRALADALATGQPRWLPARSVLLLQLFAHMFPASDFRCGGHGRPPAATAVHMRRAASAGLRRRLQAARQSLHLSCAAAGA